jgi:hypothetical protein
MGLSFTIAAGPRQRSHSRSESPGDHFLLFQTRDSPNLEGQVHVFISPRNRVAQLYLQALGSFSSPPTTRRATVEVFDPTSTRDSELSSELISDWRFTANQFVLMISPLSLSTSNLFFQLNTCGCSPYVTSSLMRCV